jgi:hypothetical protein
MAPSDEKKSHTHTHTKINKSGFYIYFILLNRTFGFVQTLVFVLDPSHNQRQQLHQTSHRRASHITPIPQHIDSQRMANQSNEKHDNEGGKKKKPRQKITIEGEGYHEVIIKKETRRKITNPNISHCSHQPHFLFFFSLFALLFALRFACLADFYREKPRSAWGDAQCGGWFSRQWCSFPSARIRSSPAAACWCAAPDCASKTCITRIIRHKNVRIENKK